MSSLPTLINHIYGVFQWTGLYSFQFVDKSRNPITEIFFLTPPKSKNVSEPTRSATIPTLSSNYNLDAGNATKPVTLTGTLYFPYIGSPDNPVARDNSGLENTLTGLEEFFKLRWMLIRYRDYTMTNKAQIMTPPNLLSIPEIAKLHKTFAKKIKNRTGVLMDEIQLIFHDYDMDDHFYARVSNFSSTQSDAKHLAIDYTIEIECYEPDTGQKSTAMEIKQSVNESIDKVNSQINQLDFDTEVDNIQGEIGYNYSFLNTVIDIQNTLSDIDSENENIQAGKSTLNNNLPAYVNDLMINLNLALVSFTETFLSPTQKADLDSGDLTLDEVLDIDLLSFYNSVQKIKLQGNILQGIIKSTVSLDELRYYSDADDYTLTEEQFEDPDAGRTENTTNFYYYEVIDGDTARSIAQKELKDYEKFIQILKLNNIQENDFIDGSLIGQKIKIPYPITVTSRGEDNLVYEKDYNDPEKFIFGANIALGLNKEILVSSGKIRILAGIENAFRSVEKRVQNRKGSLNIFHPNWGTIAIGESNAPVLVQIDRYLTDMITQIQSDPRVESAQIKLDKIEWDGEKISVPTKVYFINSEQTREVNI